MNVGLWLVLGVKAEASFTEYIIASQHQASLTLAAILSGQNSPMKM